MSPHLCPMHFSLSEKLNIPKDQPQATEFIPYCTALVLMSWERAEEIRYWIQTQFSFGCTITVMGLQKFLPFQINLYLGLPTAVDFSENELCLAFLQVPLSTHHSQTRNGHTRSYILQSAHKFDRTAICNDLSSTLTMLSHEMVLREMDQVRFTLPEFERWQRGLPFALLVCETSEKIPHLGPCVEVQLSHCSPGH